MFKTAENVDENISSQILFIRYGQRKFVQGASILKTHMGFYLCQRVCTVVCCVYISDPYCIVEKQMVYSGILRSSLFFPDVSENKSAESC